MRHLPARVVELDEYPFEKLCKERVVIFVVSTTGGGEMPPNMRHFWKLLLRKSLPPNLLENVNIAVLGLGDSSYQNFNFAGKKLFRRLLQLGAKMLTEVILADDQHELGIDGAFVPWKNRIWEKIKDFDDTFPNMSLHQDPSVTLEPKLRFDYQYEKAEKRQQGEEYRALVVESNQRVTAEDHFQDTRLVKFEIPANSTESWIYQPGDVLMVRPCNLEESVKIAIEAFDYSAELLDRPARIVQTDDFTKAPPAYLIGDVTTLRICIERYFDLQQVPKRSFFEMLSYYSTDESEKERLAELASPQGLDDLLEYANRCRRTTAEALRDFPKTAKSLLPDQLFEIFTPIRPRAFSIASAPIQKSIELLVAKVEYSSRMADKRKGLCSTFISRLKWGDKVFCKIRPGTFKFPRPENPLICIGPGTGVAPFRSLFKQRSNEPNTSNSLLFFGCRSKYSDFYFENEWNVMEGVETIVAFSRDTVRKVYVQDKMKERVADIEALIDAGASIFVAGSTGDMPKAVLNVIKQIKGEQWTLKAEASAKIQFETWS
uniref:NADPH-dependent diflavin oxidoreductase 1 n=1 Tax=Caenorhabditis japonica TaxID=281687 RepID=A0A8R1ICT1_CAEJA